MVEGQRGDLLLLLIAENVGGDPRGVVRHQVVDGGAVYRVDVLLGHVTDQVLESKKGI